MVLGVYGAGGLGREVLELAHIVNEKENYWEDLIFIDDGTVPAVINSASVYKYNEAMDKYGKELEVAIAIGEPAIRESVFKKLENDGIHIPTLIHPDVYVPKTTSIGKGVIIHMGNYISCNVVIEDYVYIQPHANIGHNDILKQGSIISGFCNLAGNVAIGRFTYMGISSCCKEGVNIGDFSIIGMASVVYRDIPDEVIAMGNPARPIRRNEERQVFK